MNLTHEELRQIGYNRLNQFTDFQDLDEAPKSHIVEVFALGMREMETLLTQEQVLSNHFKNKEI